MILKLPHLHSSVFFLAILFKLFPIEGLFCSPFFQLLQSRVGFTFGVFLAPARNVPVNMTTTLTVSKETWTGSTDMDLQNGDKWPDAEDSSN